MRKILTLVAATALPLAALVASESISAKVSERFSQQTTEAFKFTPKAKYERNNRNEGVQLTKKKPLGVRSKVVSDSDINRTLPGGYSCGYLDAPDGSIWYYIGNIEYEEVELEGGWATKKVINSYSFTIYDDNYKEVGTIQDKVVLGENETGVSSIQLGACVTKKFFNTDNNYEVMVMIAANTPQYVNHTYTKVYSIGGSDEAIQTIEGYYVSSFNAGSEYSEKFYITFFEETYLNSAEEKCDSSEDDAVYTLHYEVMAPASWSSAEPSLIKTFNIPYDYYEGSDGLPFFGVAHDSKPYFATVKFEKPFFANSGIVIDPETGEMNRDMTPNLDNSLVIDLYTYSTYGGFADVCETKIPMVIKDETGTQCCSFYELGILNYDEDVSFGMWNDGDLPAYLVTIEDYLTSDDESQYAFKVYDTEGKLIADIADEVDGLVDVSDINGFEHQQGFYKAVDGIASFQFVDMPSCNVAATLPVATADNSLTSTCDRYVSGSSYQYCISLSYGETDNDDNTSHIFNWYKTDGTLDHVDAVPLGKQVAMALPYVKTKVLSPYFYNTDAKREYMFLLKNYVSSSSTETKESLVILNTDGDVIAKLTGNDELGYLTNIVTVNTDTNPALWLTYYNDDTDVYTPAFLDLPLTKFAGGDGTAENPYLIATVGDLQQVRSDLSANYKVANNIDASSYSFQPIAGEFTGTLDGNNKTISNLSINSDEYYSGIFQNLSSGAVVKDLVLDNVTFVVNEGTSSAGVIAANALGSGTTAPSIENVNIYNLDASLTDGANATFGGIVGKMALYASVKACSVNNSIIDLPYEGEYSTGTVGGIAGDIRTSSTINDGAFSGYIAGGVGVGGIVGKVTSGDETVANCHVDADITGTNTIGGVAGSAARAKVYNCLVEGSVSSLKNEKWGNGALTGGLIGSLSEDWTGSGLEVVSNNVVAVKSINVPSRPSEDEYDNQSATAHRIIGYSIENNEPGKDGSHDADKGLVNNYAVEDLAVVDSNVEAAANTTEGASIAAADLNKSFFESLGFVFGDNVDAPWVMTDALPVLYIENTLAAGVSNVTVATPVSFNGKTVVAQGCNVALFNLTGVKVAENANSLSMANLSAGVYVVVVTDANGHSSAFKAAVK
jgi:hypothetical protein